MNEKIKELALKNVQHLDWDPPSEPKEYTFTDKGLEKFAELIVRECAEISKNYAGGSVPLSIALAIKQHFGVE